ncbi:hypothetical protein ACOMHN_015227 [Nucella lapillus]
MPICTDTLSCHPEHTIQNLPYNLFLCLRRLCSLPETLETRCQELEQQLLDSGHSPEAIQGKNKAKDMSRHDNLQSKAKQHREHVPFLVTHHPCNLPLRQWLQSFHSEMACTSRRMSDAVPEPPIVGECKRHSHIIC